MGDRAITMVGEPLFEQVDMIKVVGMYQTVNKEEQCYSVTILIFLCGLYL